MGAKREYLFTSESVTEAHPDKLCDGISDSVLDACLSQDVRSRVACEALVKSGLVVVAGEITTNANIDFREIVRRKIRDVGYTDPAIGFSAETCAIVLALTQQSSDIAQGVNEGKAKGKLSAEQGAGDQGMMFGYACNETEELMPAPIMYAHKLVRRLTEVRRKGILKFLRPDGKSQVTFRYVDDCPVEVVKVVVSAQHSPEIEIGELREAIIEEVVKPVIPEELRRNLGKKDYLINPTGKFVIGGPQGDCGVTGRKIIVDTYGGMGRHGGGAFSGKDPSKVDRSAAYMARYIAKNIVAARLATRCEVQLAYAIGYADPVSVMVNTFGTHDPKVSDERLERAVRKVFGLKPREIIEQLNLLRPIYEATSAYGHFGRQSKRELETFTWERTDRVDELRAQV